MSTRPDDIPQDVWSAAVTELSFPGIHVHQNSYGLVCERFARAILAAKAGEREACAKEVVDYMNEVAVANDEARQILYATGLTTNENSRRADLIAVIRDDLSDAIRKRGEADVNSAHKNSEEV